MVTRDRSAPPPFSPVVVQSGAHRPRAFHAIVDQLRDDIFRGRRKPGDRLPPEQVLAEQFKVSRTGVREALRVLEIQGLVQVRHGYGGGVFVADVGVLPLLGALQTSLQLGQLDVDELYEARVLVEPTVVRLAVERAGGSLAGELDDNIARAHALIARGTTAFPMNLEFHALLAQAAGNRILGLVTQALLELLERLHHEYPTNRAVSRRALDDHRRLVDAVRARDGRHAEALMVDHLRILEIRFSRIRAQIRHDRGVKVKTIPPWRGVRLGSGAPAPQRGDRKGRKGGVPDELGHRSP